MHWKEPDDGKRWKIWHLHSANKMQIEYGATKWKRHVNKFTFWQIVSSFKRYSHDKCSSARSHMHNHFLDDSFFWMKTSRIKKKHTHAKNMLAMMETKACRTFTMTLNLYQARVASSQFK